MEQIRKSKKYMAFCEPCSYKAIIDKDQSDLVEIKTSPIPGGIPELDAKTGKTKNKPQKTQSKKFKCPKCGRGIVIKELQGAHANAIKQRDAKIEAQKIEDDRKQRLQDGKPFERLNSEESEGKL